jgi:hypothetical protein
MPVGPVPVSITVGVAVVRTACSTASYWMLAARRETILRYRYRSCTREQRCDNGEIFQGGHLNPLSAYAYTHPDFINAYVYPPVPLDGLKFSCQ